MKEEFIKALIEKGYSKEYAEELVEDMDNFKNLDSDGISYEMDTIITGIDAMTGYPMINDVGSEDALNSAIEALENDNKVFEVNGTRYTLQDDWESYAYDAADEHLADFQSHYLDGDADDFSDEEDFEFDEEYEEWDD